MKQQILLLLTLLLLAGCQVSDSGSAGGEIISDHTPLDNKFTLTTTLNKTYLVTETINLVLNFPKTVVVAGGTPSIDITLGSTVRTVPLASGTGTSALTFSYVVVPGDDDSNGISVSTTLNKNTATIKYDGLFETSSVIAVPNLSTVLINTVSGSAPVAANITPASFNEDTQRIITLSYTDAESNLASSCAISTPTNVTVTQACACAAGTCTVGVTGTANYNGAASFAYTVTANSQVSNSATATLSITAVDDAPVAANISPPAFNSNTQSVITLSYSDVELHSASVCSISSPTNVTVTQACACAAGVCTVGVTSTLNYSGAGSFLYTVTANGLVSNSATATLVINSTAAAPVAANISPAAFNEDTQSVITLSYTDAESDLATSCVISSPTNVTVTSACACVTGVCSVGITGTANYHGAASFTYTVTANSQISNSATATLSITSVDDAPVASNISPAAFNEDIQSIITLSYVDVDSDQASACAISGLTNVTVTQPCACAAGVCTVGVTGTSNYNGAASFNYTVTANSVVSNSATASLTITLVNDPPVASNITPAAFNEDVQSIITLSYTDADSDLASSCTLSSLSNVTVTQACACAAGVCTVGVTGTSNYNGAASFGYTVTANTQTSNVATATLSITPVADAPVATNITPAAFNEDTIGNITLVYSDAEGDLATSCAVSALSNVTVTTACTCVVGTCTVSVQGTANYNGVASFEYTVTAAGLTSNSATASLTISSVEDAAVTTNTSPAAFNEDVQSIITLTHTDVDSQSTTCSISSATNVSVTQACACAAGVCTVGVTGTANYFGAASFAFTVTSNSVTSNSSTASLTINSVNDLPVISAISTQNGAINASAVVTFTITDIESSLNCGSSMSMTSSNTALVPVTNVVWSGTAPNCTGTVSPVTNMTGSSTIGFVVTDGNSATATSSFTMNTNGARLVWTTLGDVEITAHSFGDPNANTSVDVLVKNVGNQTSAAITITDGGATNRIGHTGTCTTLAVNATCPITITWTDSNPAGYKEEIFTATAAGAVTATITASGTK